MTTRGRSNDPPADDAATLGDVAEVAAAVVAEVAEVADRLRRLPESRLRRVEAAARALAQALADAAAGVEQRATAAAPPGRVVPTLSPFAVADQVTVTVRDLEAAATGLGPDTAVWWAGARRPLGAVLAALADRARALRAEV